MALAVLLDGAAMANALPPMCRAPRDMIEAAGMLRRVLAGWDVCRVPEGPEARDIQATLGELMAGLDRLDAAIAAEHRERLDRQYREEHYEFRRRIAFEPDLCTQPAMRPPGPGYLRQVTAYRAELAQRLAPGGAWSALQCDAGARR